jgi:transposase-like protein
MPQFATSDVKEKVLAEVKEGKAPVADIARSYGIKPGTVYNWVSRGVAKDADIMEVRRLRRKVLELYEIIGKLTEGLEKFKKN